MSIRTERVGEEMKKVLSERLLRGVRDPLPGFVTIAAVEVTSDFSMAKVFVSVIGSDADKQGALAVLQQNKGLLRKEVGQNIRLRLTPELKFVLDESGERAARVLSLLHEEGEKEKARKRAAAPADAAAEPVVVVEAAPAAKVAAVEASPPAAAKKSATKKTKG